MSDTEYSSLRFVVPVDPSRADDAALMDAFDGVPNGLIGTFARMLLLRALPHTQDELDALMLTALADQAARKRVRGRPSAKSEKPAVRPTIEPQRQKPVAPKLNDVVPMAPAPAARTQEAVSTESSAAPVGAAVGSLTDVGREASSGEPTAEQATAPARKVSSRVANLVG